MNLDRFMNRSRREDHVTTWWFRRLTEEDGQDLIEYALLASVLSVGGILSIHAVLGGVMPWLDRIIAAFRSL
jgi:Flp pilus assembly pilin Flp